MISRHVAIALTAMVSVFSGPGRCQDQPSIPETTSSSLNVLAWSDYFDPYVLADFETETGIKVTYDTYQSSAGLEAVLAAPNAYDVVVFSGPQLQQAIASGRLQKLDKASISHLSEAAPELQTFLASYDPANQYGVIYTWFTTGLAFNVNLAKARLGDNLPISWETIFRPEVLKRFADCGVEIIDSPVDLFSSALFALKLSPQSRNPAELKRAADLLFRLKPYIRRFNSVDYPQALARGDICLAIGWTEDAVLARKSAQEANNGVDISYGIPKEGTLVSLDTLALSRTAPHATQAYQFIDFLMRPDIAARNSRATGLATAIVSAVPLLDHAIASDPAIYPKGDVLKRLLTAPLYDRAAQDLVGREWARIKNGK
jgi:putrescine transport system substrate-binding protein